MGEIVIKNDADVNDTIKLIVDTIKAESNTPAVIKCAKDILAQSENLNDVLFNLFNYVCNNVKYKLDPNGFERVTTPRRLISDGYGDCKKMTVYIATVLRCLGIDCILRVISYDGETYEHIYVVVPTPSGIVILDPVNDKQFNKEIPHKKQTDIFIDNKSNPMRLSLLNGKPSPVIRFDVTDSPDNYNTPTRFLSQLSGSLDFNTQPTAESRFLNYLSGSICRFDGGLNAVCGLGDDFWGEAFDTIKHISNGGIDILIDNIRNKGLSEGLSTVLDAASKEFDKATLVFKTINGAGTRVAFAVVVSVNFSNIAGDLYNAYLKDPNKVVNWWQNDMGGQWSDLKEAINNGLTYAGTGKHLSGIGWTAASVTAAVVAATGVIAAATQMIKTINPATDVKPYGVNTAAAMQQFKDSVNAAGQGSSISASSIMSYAPYILGGALLIYALK